MFFNIPILLVAYVKNHGMILESYLTFIPTLNPWTDLVFSLKIYPKIDLITTRWSQTLSYLDYYLDYCNNSNWHFSFYTIFSSIETIFHSITRVILSKYVRSHHCLKLLTFLKWFPLSKSHIIHHLLPFSDLISYYYFFFTYCLPGTLPLC